ncbi:formin-like protein 2 [Primulina huaijiensis]|uniref:formin-like protein 2 n=1 Tax=Primulina huaijiensis TaxID=1492673 RepID=UPI003CC747A4
MLHLYLPTIALSILTVTTAAANRRILHQPLFPVDQLLPPTPAATISQPPFSSPSPQPVGQPPLTYPFSALYPPDTATQNPFFPVYYSPPPPPPPPPSTTAFPTFPANISSLVLPSSSSPTSHKPTKLILLVLSVSLLSVVLLALSVFLHRCCHHRHNQRTEKRPLFPPNTTPSDTSATTTSKYPPPLPRYTASSNSSEFLYLGTLVSSRDANGSSTSELNEIKAPPLAAASLNYQRLGSPELQPLPPLPREHANRVYDNARLSSSSEGEGNDNGSEKEDAEVFFSPGGSTGNNEGAFPHVNTFNNSGNDLKGRIFISTNDNSSRNSLSSDGSPSVVLNSCSPLSVESKSPDSLVSFPPVLSRFIPPPPARQPRVFSAISSSDGHTPDYSSDCPGVEYVPSPPQAPPPPERLWESVPQSGPPELLAPSLKVVQNVDEGKRSSSNLEGGNEENVKPKLKPLHWDKVRTSSDRTMVWDQMKSSSFQLNEEMIETLFPANSSNMNAKNTVGCQIFPDTSQKNMVLDPKKSQNIAILLRALNVTVDEVCEALVEGNADTLGTELLESLLKMAPTKEEERKLKDLMEESPFKLGTAETFLKALLDIPFAFKRVDAMLYMASFESEVEYLNRSFETLESACKELKSSRMFRKLLEAVLKTGNRMNVGTNRGDAHAFDLHALLKLVDVKGADGKTTLLHFVVQEIIRTEGARLSGVDHNTESEKSQQPTLRDEVEFRKIGLQVVSGLSGELTNVKKAASMDANVLGNDVTKLVTGISNVTEVLKLHEEVASKDDTGKFACHTNEFLNKAESEIARIQAQEGIALSMVKGLTEFFHGDSAKEDTRSFWLFVIVRDFLSILDNVCKDVGKINERAMVNSNSGSQIQIPTNPCLPRVFPRLNGSPQYSSSDGESSSST